MIKIGITGGIGSGKSTICRLFAVLGVAVYNSDSRARNLMQSDPEVISAIRALFGDNAYIHGSLNRPYIAQLVFHQPDLRERLNHIVHPAVAKDFDQWAEKQPGHYVIEEAAILFESGAYRNMDAVVTVSTPEAQRIQRTCLRDHTDEASVRQRIAAQMSEEERITRADYVIVSDDRTPVIPQVLKLHAIFNRL